MTSLDHRGPLHFKRWADEHNKSVASSTPRRASGGRCSTVGEQNRRRRVGNQMTHHAAEDHLARATLRVGALTMGRRRQSPPVIMVWPAERCPAALAGHVQAVAAQRLSDLGRRQRHHGAIGAQHDHAQPRLRTGMAGEIAHSGRAVPGEPMRLPTMPKPTDHQTGVQSMAPSGALWHLGRAGLRRDDQIIGAADDAIGWARCRRPTAIPTTRPAAAVEGLLHRRHALAPRRGAADAPPSASPYSR